jgi:hypothetical protein
VPEADVTEITVTVVPMVPSRVSSSHKTAEAIVPVLDGSLKEGA